MRRCFGLLMLTACTAGTTTTTTLPPPETVASPSTTETSPPITTTLPALIDHLPGGPCELGEVPEEGEVTFAVGARLYGARPDGGGMRCLVEVEDPITGVEWSPTGDRLILNNVVHPQDSEVGPPPLNDDDLFAFAVEWTRPTGQGIVYQLLHRGGGNDLPLVKSKDGEFLDLAPVPGLANPVYHPAGTHIAAQTGTELWLMSNDGTTAVVVASDEGARIGDYRFDLNGDLLFIGAHEATYHLHKLVAGSDGRLESPTLVEHSGEVADLTVSPFAPLTAYSERIDSCGPRLGVIGIAPLPPLESLGVRPVGWLPDDQLVVLVGRPDCRPLHPDVYVFSTGLCPGAPLGIDKLVEGVDLAAVRLVSPPPPPPPGAAIIESTAPA